MWKKIALPEDVKELKRIFYELGLKINLGKPEGVKYSIHMNKCSGKNGMILINLSYRWYFERNGT